MGKIILIILIAFALFAAYSSKPDDKTCIIAAVKAVWGNRVPNEKLSMYFNQFMDIASQSVKVNNWIFMKSIEYKYKNEYKTVGFGAFKKVYIF